MQKFALAFCLASGLAFAQTEDENLSLSDLMNIKLQTGSFLELDLARSPISMTVIGQDKVELSGARHLSELLEIYVPGFQYMFNKWNGMQWGMRGVANDRNTKFIVLVNGHKMNTEARDGFFQEVELGLLGDVERVEVLRGPAGLVYGSGAIAGIVNIVTRKANGKNAVEASVKGGMWENLGQTSREVDIRSYSTPAAGHELVATLGWKQSDGTGNGNSRLYGNPHWPYPHDKPNPGGVPADGSAWSTPGNWRSSLDWSWNRLRIYMRGSRQVSQAGGMFVKDPWPTVMGNPADAVAANTRWNAVVDSIGKTGNLLDAQGAWKSWTTRIGTSIDTAGVRAGWLSDSLTLVSLRNGAPKVPGNVMIDGKSVSPSDPLWSQTESWATNRREYVSENLLADATWSQPLGENEVKLHLAWDGNTNRIQREMRPGYAETYATDERQSFIEETFGERRYTLGALYLLKSVPKLQLAAGYELRIDEIGNDLSGRNAQAEKATHRIVSDVTYYNNAVFAEGFYDLTDILGVHAGYRWDGHTRTIDQGGTHNGKLALVYQPAPGHSIKLIGQTSSNNGSADNYEFNRNNFNDQNQPYTQVHFEKPMETPGLGSAIVYGVTQEQLHELKPEKVYSFELTSSHQFSEASVAPSISYNMVRDLFAWDQKLFRIVNVGEYNHLDVDLEASWKRRWLSVGANHGLQMVVNTDVDGQTTQFAIARYTKDTLIDGTVKQYPVYAQLPDGSYVPVVNSSDPTTSTTVNPVKTQITADGSSFLSLASNVTKFWVDVQPFDWMTIHTDTRIFWGLDGRDSIAKVDEAKGMDYANLTRDAMIKWNMSVHFRLPAATKLSLYAYDILGETTGDNAIHSLRWQQRGADDHSDLFAVDQRSFAAKLEKAF